MEFEHFAEAQEGVYEEVLAELRAGRKRSHWMWFIFPQVRGLGRSAMSEQFAIDSMEAARRYLEHKVLGTRLRECTELVLQQEERTAEEIFGGIDGMKFRSSMTLFSLASGAGSLFERALAKYFGGEKDERTLEILGWRGGAD